ncbi:MAG TPA: LysM domain-containing protein [Planctomycetota bacterium]|nr:LysM domain-containing protein [Planctomycetota bacterium]
MNFSAVSSRLLSVAALSVAAGCLLVSTGCGKSKAAAASSTAPQSLSEPVRPMEESEPATPPAIPVSNNDEYAVQKTGNSRELPTFIPPSSPQPLAAAPAAIVQLDEGSKGGAGKYHTLAKGETLYGLSRKYNVKVKDLIAVNNFKDPNKLSVGTKVYIPN